MSDQDLMEGTESLADDLRKAHHPIFEISALLAGAEALLEKAESMPDPDGVIWSAVEIVRHTQTIVDNMTAGLDSVATRVEKAEKAAAP